MHYIFFPQEVCWAAIEFEVGIVKCYVGNYRGNVDKMLIVD